MSRTSRRNVIAVQRVLPSYRIPFFDSVHKLLDEAGIGFELQYGQHEPGHVPRTVRVERPWAKPVKNRYLRLPFSRTVVWHPVLYAARSADLVIVENALRLLPNFVFHLGREFGAHLLAYWGHGSNFQHQNGMVTDQFRKWLSKRVDWWFAYTDRSRTEVCNMGFPEGRITVVDNSIDTSSFEQALNDISEGELRTVAASLELQGNHIGLFCGGMYAEKRLGFLIQACVCIRQLVPDFEMIFVGDGPDAYIVERACEEYPWMHRTGAVFGAERAVYFALSQIVLMPGALGLVIVDSFVAKRPLFTTDERLHGPEIAYLIPEVNGCITAPNVHDYANAVARYFGSTIIQDALMSGCAASARRYTIQNMTMRFSSGVIQCLACDSGGT